MTDASVGELMRQSRTDVRTFRDCERKEHAESNFNVMMLSGKDLK